MERMNEIGLTPVRKVELADLLLFSKGERERSINKLREEQIAQELKLCPFSPKTNLNPFREDVREEESEGEKRGVEGILPRYEALYRMNKPKVEDRRREDIEYEKEKENCSFYPWIERRREGAGRGGRNEEEKLEEEGSREEEGRLEEGRNEEGRREEERGKEEGGRGFEETVKRMREARVERRVRREMERRGRTWTEKEERRVREEEDEREKNERKECRRSEKEIKSCNNIKILFCSDII